MSYLQKTYAEKNIILKYKVGTEVSAIALQVKVVTMGIQVLVTSDTMFV